MIKIRFAVALTVTLLWLAPMASAHYLWLAIDRAAGDNGAMNLYFEEGPRAGDGKYLDPFVDHGQAWIRTAGDKKSTPLKLIEVNEQGKRWLTSPLPKSAPRSVASYGKWGVYRYGDTDVLLHYYAKSIDAKSAGQIADLSSSPELKLDIRPSLADGSLSMQVLWGGKPAAGRPVAVRGPSGFKRNLKTDDEGFASFKVESSGRYTLKTNVEEDKSGIDGGKQYQKVRHHSTVVIALP